MTPTSDHSISVRCYNMDRGTILWIICLFVFVVAMYPTKSLAVDMFGVQNANLDAKYCHQKTFRTTVVYIDDMMMKKGQERWAFTLADKLGGTLTPGERVTVVELSPAQGLSHEIWSACWPNYPEAKLAELAKQNHFFSKNPIEGLKTQQNLFLHEFGGALTKIYDAGLRQGGNAYVSAQSPPKKSIIDALASDSARFSESSNLIRAIVYSDLAENGSHGSIFSNPSVLPDKVGSNLGTYFRNSVFYFFGVGNDVRGASDFLGRARKFWTVAMASMQAPINGFGSDLNVPNEIPVALHRYAVSLNRDGTTLSGRASLMTDKSGNLTDSWLGINRLTFVGLAGSLQCAHSGAHCSIQATTDGGLVTNASSEAIDLTGTSLNELSGKIGVESALTLPVTFKQVQDWN